MGGIKGGGFYFFTRTQPEPAVRDMDVVPLKNFFSFFCMKIWIKKKEKWKNMLKECTGVRPSRSEERWRVLSRKSYSLSVIMERESFVPGRS